MNIYKVDADLFSTMVESRMHGLAQGITEVKVGKSSVYVEREENNTNRNDCYRALCKLYINCVALPPFAEIKGTINWNLVTDTISYMVAGTGMLVEIKLEPWS